MLIPQDARREPTRRQGGRRAGLADLRQSLARPSALRDAHRQRLLDLAQRTARIRALGGEYAGIELSEFALAALRDGAGVA